MKKHALALAILASTTAAQAGTMGPVATGPLFVPYIVGEASYTSIDTDHFIVNDLVARHTTQGWGGRLGAGAIHFMNSNLGFTGEIGGGSYGSYKHVLCNSSRGEVAGGHASIDGYDVLVGAIYKYDEYKIDIFGEAGFMVQNVRSRTFQNITALSGTPLLTGFAVERTNHSQALPEIKVGGIYNVTPNWGLTVAYMGAFGSTPGFRSSTTVTAAPLNFNVNEVINTMNPTLNSVMFGLRYTIV